MVQKEQSVIDPHDKITLDHKHICLDMLPGSYDKKSDEGSNSVRMRPENSGALKVVKKRLSTRISESEDAQLSDYV